MLLRGRGLKPVYFNKLSQNSKFKYLQVIGQAEMLVRYAGVNPKDIKGMRAPFLAVGGDTMFRMLNR